MISVGIFAHNEAHRIAASLHSLPLHREDIRFHLLVNGSSDSTAEIARSIAANHPSLIVHDLPQGGKSRTWNHYIHHLIRSDESHFVFMDGDATLTPNAIDALCASLDSFPMANAASGMPMNGRQHRKYQETLRRDRGLFGDLYALSAGFVQRIRDQGLHLPNDLIGDDGLIGAWARCDLRNEKDEDRMRIVPCEAAGFYCQPFSMQSPAAWRLQYKRMINYSVRHFQNRMISAIMRDNGPYGGAAGLPEKMADLYPAWLGQMRARSHPKFWWFDHRALRRMRAHMQR
jgi:glycosyltransferase involved in cell wall biosynthesis